MGKQYDTASDEKRACERVRRLASQRAGVCMRYFIKLYTVVLISNFPYCLELILITMLYHY